MILIVGLILHVYVILCAARYHIARALTSPVYSSCFVVSSNYARFSQKQTIDQSTMSCINVSMQRSCRRFFFVIGIRLRLTTDTICSTFHAKNISRRWRSKNKLCFQGL